jgi:hypothetical protein
LIENLIDVVIILSDEIMLQLKDNADLNIRLDLISVTGIRCTLTANRVQNATNSCHLLLKPKNPNPTGMYVLTVGYTSSLLDPVNPNNHGGEHIISVDNLVHLSEIRDDGFHTVVKKTRKKSDNYRHIRNSGRQ